MEAWAFLRIHHCQNSGYTQEVFGWRTGQTKCICTSWVEIQSGGEELDLKKLSAFLYANELADRVDAPIELLQYSNGYSNLTYFIKTGDKEYVLRRPPHGAIKRGHDMGREYKVLSNLSKHFSKAPKTFAFEETESVLGSPFYLMEKVNGVVINYQEAKR